MVVQGDDMFVGSTIPSEYMGSWLTDALGKLKGTGVNVGVGDTTVSLNNAGGLSVQKGAKTPSAGSAGLMDTLKKNWMYIAGAGVVIYLLTKKKAVV